jgi:hypothetical protein
MYHPDNKGGELGASGRLTWLPEAIWSASGTDNRQRGTMRDKAGRTWVDFALPSKGRCDHGEKDEGGAPQHGVHLTLPTGSPKARAKENALVGLKQPCNHTEDCVDLS